MKTILVVEDEYSIAELLKAVLESEGYRIVAAGDGEEGLVRLGEVYPDLVLCDVMMPVLDGRQLCQAMASNPEYRHIPLVLMSAAGEFAVKNKCKYDAFINKPFDLDRLLDIVDQLISEYKES